MVPAPVQRVSQPEEIRITGRVEPQCLAEIHHCLLILAHLGQFFAKSLVGIIPRLDLSRDAPIGTGLDVGGRQGRHEVHGTAILRDGFAVTPTIG